jgi:hypothetical protein
MLKSIPMIVIILTLALVTFSTANVRAERATSQEMELVCHNWLSYMVYQKGSWAGQSHPHIVAIDEIVEEDIVLARCFSISPGGFVVVPVIKELPPIKAYSERCRLDTNEEGGFAQLLREVLLDRMRLFTRVYGSPDAIQPPTGDVLLGRGHRAEWNRFLKSEEEFKNDLIVGEFDPLTEAGPLLTTSWHQYAPYNGLCPTGDVNCIICPSGKPPTFPCKVGCVATATAQILKYWNWPPSGTGTHSYWWDGDYSCDGSSPGAWLTADYSDPYDWAHMPDSFDIAYTPEDSVAVAELCYEVGVAFEMMYGVCGSGTWTSMALDVFPTYFRYDPSIDKEDRDQHDAAEWFAIIQEEIDNSRPIQYRIDRHSIVCDGWRDTGGLNQYHMNYGWGGSATAWYSIDSLYCYWVLPDSLCPPMDEYLIKNIYPLYDSIPFAPAVNYGAGDGPSSVFCADLDGDTNLDLAVTNWGSDSVSVLKNNGDGTYQTSINFGVGDGPQSVFCADLDNDNDLDLAVANYSSYNISILKNNGNGTYQTAVNYVGFSLPRSVFCADLDNDNDLDLAVANEGIHNVSISKNNGDGTYQTAVYYEAGYYPSSVFCGDLDSDYDIDLAVANGGGDNVSVLKNNGDGTYQTAVNYGVGIRPTSVFCADLDNDNDLDLAVANFNSDNISILKNNGDGTYQGAVNYGVGDAPYSVFCADLDGDADLDLAIANVFSDNISILKNNGDGIYQTAINYGAGVDPSSVFSADLDGETDLDLAVANSHSDEVSILKNLTQTSGNSPPYSFSLLSPADGDTTSGIVEFDWAATQDVNLSDQIRYDLYVSTIPDFDPDSTVVHDSLTCSGLTDTLQVDRYYWKVKAYDNWGAETWSDQTWHFVYFLRGDASGDGVIDPADVVYLINYLFRNGTAPDPLATGDANCDGLVDPADVVFLINYLFRNGDPPGCE